VDPAIASSHLSSDERRTLAAVLDEIIPPSPHGRLPGAGELGLVDHVEAILARTPELRPVITQGLAALDEIARSRGAAGFAALAREQRSHVMRELPPAEPLVPTLVFHAYTGYYQAGRVLEGLGLEPRPPHPKGHVLEPGDLSGLDAVRRRGKIYRDC
jgi:hypothetical protein